MLVHLFDLSIILNFHQGKLYTIKFQIALWLLFHLYIDFYIKLWLHILMTLRSIPDFKIILLYQIFLRTSQTLDELLLNFAKLIRSFHFKNQDLRLFFLLKVSQYLILLLSFQSNQRLLILRRQKFHHIIWSQVTV